MPNLEPVVDVVEATVEDAAQVHALIQAAFGARPPLDPPTEALTETVASIRAQLGEQTGVLALVDGKPAGCLIVDAGAEDAAQGSTVMFRRVSVHPSFQGHKLAWVLVEAAENLAAVRGARQVELVAREEFPELVSWWAAGGYQVRRKAPNGLVLAKALPIVVRARNAEAMRAVGARLAAELTGGDVLIASGELGAGKTTLTQGIAAGLEVDGPVISPTFVLSRIHPSRGSGPGLVHVDAYRLGSAGELDDLDLDDTLASSVTVIEWGSGLAEQLSESRLDIHIDRASTDGERLIIVRAVGPRWQQVDLRFLEGQRL